MIEVLTFVAQAVVTGCLVVLALAIGLAIVDFIVESLP
jgi:hypothetical protein